MIQFEEDDILHCVLIEPKKMNDEKLYNILMKKKKKNMKNQMKKEKKGC